MRRQGNTVDTINDLDDINENSSWKKSIDDAFADDHYSEKRSVIHIDNITHGHVNINMTNASLISPRVTPAMVTRWTPSSHLQESGHRGSQHPLPGDSPAQRRPRVHVRVPPDSL